MWENEIIYNTEVLKSNLCDYNDAYKLGRGNITIVGHNVNEVALKNWAPFIKCIAIIDGTTIDSVADLDLLEYNLNYSDTTGSLWFYSKDKANNFNNDIENTNNLSLSIIKLNQWETMKLMDQIKSQEIQPLLSHQII